MGYEGVDCMLQDALHRKMKCGRRHELHMRTDYEWVPSPILEALQRPITMQPHPVGGDLSSHLKVCPPFRLRLELFYVIFWGKLGHNASKMVAVYVDLN